MTKERFDWIVRNIDFERLSDWETTFLESCDRCVNRGRELSEKQEEILEEMHRMKS